MTKYVVNSGNVRGNLEKAKKYVSEILNGLGKNPKILFCFFANSREEWEERFEKYKNDFKNYLGSGINPKYDLAIPKDFVEQCAEADVIWVHGGDDHLVQYWLKQFDLKKIWKDKVVATSSASSDALACSFWTGDWRECMDGIGVLPMKFIAHYNSNYGNDDPRGPIDWARGLKDLKAYGDTQLPTYSLEEGDFKVFET